MTKRGELYIVGGLLISTLISGLILTSSTVSAEDYTKSALIRVQAACTLGGTVAIPHTDTISNGTYKSEIGETVLSAVCNDGGGFGIYAIGYTDDTDGNNVMKHDTDSTFDIATGIATSGNTSNWAMKLTAVEDGANTPTILNGYDSYKAVPSDYVKVASYPNATADNTNVSFLTHYATYVSLTQHSGVYTGKVKYVMVHPSTGSAPIKQLTFDGAYAAAEKEKVTVNNRQYYKEQDMTTSICNSVIEGDTTELVDIRDNTIYHVGKLADGRCWILDNLALDLTDTNVQANTNSSNTNASTASLDALFGRSNRDPSTDPNGNLATAGVINAYYIDINNNSWSYSVPVIDSSKKNYSSPDGAYITGADTWKIGIMYNYCAASAGNYCYGNGGTSAGSTLDRPNTAIDADEDICPTGWRLPTGYSYETSGSIEDSELDALLYAITGRSDSTNDDQHIFRIAFHLPIVSSINDPYGYTYVWSSTVAAGLSEDMSVMIMDADSRFIASTDARSREDYLRNTAVRCIAK